MNSAGDPGPNGNGYDAVEIRALRTDIEWAPSKKLLFTPGARLVLNSGGGMDWRAKAVVQNILSSVPLGERINNSLQVRVGGLHHFDAEVRGKLNDWIGIMKLLAECKIDVRDATTLEIGTGWFPTLPVCFWLAGTRNCITYDLRPHLRQEMTGRMISVLHRHLDVLAGAANIALAKVRQRYAEIGEDVLRSCSITYVAPGDASRTGLPDGSVDIVFSNSVLEHVTREALSAIMHETRRILRPSGVAVHCVACNDHYAHFDRRISYVNYLRFSEKNWRRWNNALHYQNRLRARDFLELAQESGLRVLAERQYIRPGVESALLSLPIAEDFRSYTRAELAATTVNFVCRAAA